MSYRYDRTGERIEPEDQEDDDPPKPQTGQEHGTPAAPPLPKLRCKRCGFLVLPEERETGHTCKRRTTNTAAWADRARAAIRHDTDEAQEPTP